MYFRWRPNGLFQDRNVFPPGTEVLDQGTIIFFKKARKWTDPKWESETQDLVSYTASGMQNHLAYKKKVTQKIYFTFNENIRFNIYMSNRMCSTFIAFIDLVPSHKKNICHSFFEQIIYMHDYNIYMNYDFRHVFI